LVSWLGFAPENNTWEPYSGIRDTAQLHRYLTEFKLTQLIPAKFR
jgi:hypothetical protein